MISHTETASNSPASTDAATVTPMAPPPVKLPAELFSSLKQYKTNTDRVASWLGATASSLGYSFAAAAPPPVQPNPLPGRLKGKARQAAGAAAAAAPPRQPGSLAAALQGSDLGSHNAVHAPPPALLTTDQFVQLARFIVAKTNPPITVPTRIIDWACRAIASRRACAEWFASEQCPTQDAAGLRSNDGHRHFIGILEQVVEILAARVGDAVETDRKHRVVRPPVSGVELLQSRFSALDAGDEDVDGNQADDWDLVFSLVEEAVGGGKSGKGAKKGGKHHQPAPSSGRKLQQHQQFRVKHQDESEFVLVLMDHLIALSEARLVIKDTWTKFVGGEVSLEVASLVTQAATDKMQLAHDALADSYPLLMEDPSEYLPTILKHVVDCVTRWRIDGKLAERLQTEAGLSSQSAQATCTNPDDEQALMDFVFWGIKDAVCVACQVVHEKRVGAGSRSGATPEKRRDRFANLAWRSFLLAKVYTSWQAIEGDGGRFEGCPIPVLSELDDLMKKTSADPTATVPVPLWTQFLALVFIDISVITAANPALTRSSFASTSVPLCHAIKQYKTHVPDALTATHSQHVIDYSDDTANLPLLWDHAPKPPSTDADGIKVVARRIVREMTAHVLQQHAWIAGLFALSGHACAMLVTAPVAQHFQFVSGAAYVYWAIRHMGLAAHADESGKAWSWGLMDELLSASNGGKGIYYGRAPANLTEACKGFMILLGGDASDLTRLHRSWHASVRGYGNQVRAGRALQISARRLNMRQEPDKFAGGLWKTRALLMPVVMRSIGYDNIAETTRAWEAAVAERIDRGGLHERQEPASSRVRQGRHKQSKAAGAAAATNSPTGNKLKDKAAQQPRQPSHPPISMTESLTHLRTHVAADMPALTTNVLLLHVQSQRILWHVRDRISAHLGPAIPKPEHAFTYSELAVWVHFLLAMLAAKDDPFYRQAGNSLGQSKEDWALAMAVLIEVKDMIEHLTSEDDKAQREAVEDDKTLAAEMREKFGVGLV